MAASIYVCESHSSSCVVTYTSSGECPFCEAEAQMTELEEKVKELEGKIAEFDNEP